MNAKEVREKIREAVEDAFDGQKDGRMARFVQCCRPKMLITSLVYSTIGRSGLCIAEIVED